VWNVALSLAVAPSVKAKDSIPRCRQTHIQQSSKGVILKSSNKDIARQFMAYIKTPPTGDFAWLDLAYPQQASELVGQVLRPSTFMIIKE
jgi:hypothetical protein